MATTATSATITWLGTDMEGFLDNLAERKVDREVFRRPEVFEWEQEKIFARTWVNVGLEQEIPTPGQYKTTRIGRMPVVVVRGRDGTIRAFQNTCPHRGALVAREPYGQCAAFCCLYHNWTFDLEGRLTGVPRIQEMPDSFRKEEHGLVPIPRVDTLYGMVFASLDPQIESLREFFAGPWDDLTDIFEGTTWELIGFQRFFVQANWKAYVENSRDPYHAGILHKMLPALGYYVDVTCKGWDRGHGLLKWPVKQSLAHATKVAGTGLQLNDYSILETSRSGWQRVMPLFPNTVITHQADILMVRQVLPVAFDRTEVLNYALVPQDASEEFKDRSAMQMANYQGPSGSVGFDDTVAVNAVQAGMAAPGVTHNVVAMGKTEYEGSGNSEAPVRAFYRYWAELMRHV